MALGVQQHNTLLIENTPCPARSPRCRRRVRPGGPASRVAIAPYHCCYCCSCRCLLACSARNRPPSRRSGSWLSSWRWRPRPFRERYPCSLDVRSRELRGEEEVVWRMTRKGRRASILYCLVCLRYPACVCKGRDTRRLLQSSNSSSALPHNIIPVLTIVQELQRCCRPACTHGRQNFPWNIFVKFRSL